MLYSATKQQAKRALMKIKQPNQKKQCCNFKTGFSRHTAVIDWSNIYKAAWRSIRTLEISETSNTYFNCRTKDKKARHEKTQGLFQCGNCSIRTNAYYNGAMILTYPEPSVIIDRKRMNPRCFSSGRMSVMTKPSTNYKLF